MVVIAPAVAALRIADDLPEADYELSPVQDGRFWSTGGGDETFANVKRPIGFMRRKPRIRVLAWTIMHLGMLGIRQPSAEMPIIPRDL